MSSVASYSLPVDSTIKQTKPKKSKSNKENHSPKEVKEKKPKAPKKEKQQGGAVQSATSSIPAPIRAGTPILPPLTTKLGAAGPAEEKKKFIKHDVKTEVVQFVGNLLKENDNGKYSLEIDDVAYKYLNQISANFSVNVDFKTPAKKNKEKYYVNGTLDTEAFGERDMDNYMRETVVVHGYLKTYDFIDDEGKQLKGCSLRITDMRRADEQPGSGDDNSMEDSD